MVIKEDQLNKEYIYFSYIEKRCAGCILPPWAIPRRGSVHLAQILWQGLSFVEQKYQTIIFDSTNAVSKAADANISASILASEPTLDDHKVKGEYLINADKIFLTEKHQPSKAYLLPYP